MKKVTSLFALILALAMLFVACGGNNDKTTTAGTTVANGTTSGTTNKTTGTSATTGSTVSITFLFAIIRYG